VIYVTAEGLPDAEVSYGGRDIELRITPPGSPVEAVIVVPLEEARVWAADVYAAVTIAHRDHTGDPTALTDDDLAALPDPGRVVVERLADRWHPDHDLHGDDLLGGGGCSSSLGSRS
jgi:hypothetical protein